MSDLQPATVITGASSSVGCALIRKFDRSDSIVCAHFHQSGDRIEALQSDTKARIIPIKADFSAPDGPLEFIESIKRHGVVPEKVVHLVAPKIRFKRFRDTNWSDFELEMNIEMRSIVLILQEFLPIMAKRRSGKVVFMLSSNTSCLPPKALAAYTTAKYALLGLMKSLASEYSDKGICINGISPSMMETDFLSCVPRQIIEGAALSHPRKRNASVEDVVPVIEFLLSSASDFVTGQNLVVAGGAVF